MRSRISALAAVLAGALALPSAWAQPAFGSGFTYQGRIDSNGTPVDGNVDLGFTLWDSPGEGNPPTGGQFIGVIALPDVRVTDGLFTVVLNANGEFGPLAFDGGNRWLQIAVNSQIVGPRQPITATPYALRATESESASHAATADEAVVALSVPGINGHSLRGAHNGPENAVYVDPIGRVGIGTTSPMETLHNAGPYYGRGSLSLFSIAGEDTDGPALIRARDYSGSSSLGFAFSTQYFGEELLSMTVNPAGNVLIGDTMSYDPDDARARLDVRGNGTDPALSVDVGWGNFVVRPYSIATPWTVLEDTSGELYVNSEIGIYRKPGVELDVAGQIRASGNCILGSSAMYPFTDTTLQVNGNSNDWAIYADGDVGVDGEVWADFYNVSSDKRFKTDITTLTGGLDMVCKLRGVRYEMDRERWPDRNFSDRPQIGFIAQEVQTVLPEVVSCDKNGYLAIDYSRVSAVLVEAVHDLNARNQEARAEIDKLHTEVDELRNTVDALLAAANPAASGK